MCLKTQVCKCLGKEASSLHLYSELARLYFCKPEELGCIVFLSTPFIFTLSEELVYREST